MQKPNFYQNHDTSISIDDFLLADFGLELVIERYFEFNLYQNIVVGNGFIKVTAVKSKGADLWSSHS